jgi:diacylglycerol kinase
MSKKHSKNSILNKLIVGFKGLQYAFKNEPTLSIQVLVGIVTTSVIAYLGGNWWFIKQTIFLTFTVVMFELVNTAFEYLCDLVEMKKNSKVKKVKDVSAGLVLVASILAIGVTVAEFINLLV